VGTNPLKLTKGQFWKITAKGVACPVGNWAGIYFIMIIINHI